MTEVKTRIEAQKASVEKWTEILEKTYEVRELIDGHCGFCMLARSKISDLFQPHCRHCEPDARRLCQEYVTAEKSESIMIAMNIVCKLVVELKDKIVSLPDVYEEE